MYIFQLKDFQYITVSPLLLSFYLSPSPLRYLFFDGESHFEVELSRISSMQVLTEESTPEGKALDQMFSGCLLSLA